MTVSVYAAYDRSGALLYVGASVDVRRRMWQHSSISCWGRDVDRLLVKELPTKAEAFRFETRAIQLLKPMYNIAVHQGSPHLYSSVKSSWVLDQIVKARGSAKRSPQEEGQTDG